MIIRKFDRATLESEPHNVLFRDLYPWDEIEETPFGASLAVVEPGGKTMVHSHHPCETFFICHGNGTMTCNGESSEVAGGDVIYLPPQSEHFLSNDSASDALMFLSVFWDAPPLVQDPAPPTSRLYVPSPPTPNGGLHLGHLSGPYLLADVLKRFDRLHGRPAGWMLVSDAHQSYVALRAHFDETSPLEATSRYSGEIVTTLQALDAVPDAVVQPAANPDYAAAVLQALKTLEESGAVTRKPGQLWHCEPCQRDLYDGYARGNCPHCSNPCRGFLCETCCMPNSPETLQDVHCLICDQPAQLRQTPQRIFSLEPYREALAAYHQDLRLSPRLRALSARFLALSPLEVVVSHPASWGIALPDGEMLSPWFELSLATPALSAGHELIHCFGADNAFLYLMLDPAVSLALQGPLARGLHGNEYLLLEDEKMSTSRGHSLNAGDLLQKYSSDLVRLLLAGLRPEASDTQCNTEMIEGFLKNRIATPWQDWLEGVGKRLTTEAGSKAPDAIEWAPEQDDFFAQLEDLLRRTAQAYERGRLQTVAAALQELVDKSAAFALSQEPLLGMPAERATGLALELAAVRLLAQLSAPLMPKLATQLWKHLGFREALSWPTSVELVPSGQRVLAAAGLSSRRYFPA